MTGVCLVYRISFFYFFFLLLMQYLYKIAQISLYSPKVIWKAPSITSFVLLLKWQDIYYYVSLQFFLLLTLKMKKLSFTGINPLCLLYLFSLFGCIWVLFTLLKYTSVTQKQAHTIFLVLVFLYFCIALFSIIKNFLILLLAIELIGTLYYFFLLTHTIDKNTTFLKLKNLLSLYLWTSFVVLCVLIVCFLVLGYTCGTLKFSQLITLKEKIPGIVWHLVFISLGWKAGSAGFQFFKLELYQFLPLFTLIVFSITTLFLNFFIFHYILTVFWPVFFVNRYVFSLYVVATNIFLLMRAQQGLLFCYFLAYSAVNTWALIFLFALV